MSVWAIVPAAGLGSRIGGDTPKQYLKLDGVAVLQRTIAQLSRVKNIDTCVVALNAQDDYFAKLIMPKDMPIFTVTGGANRTDSVFNALDFLKNHQDLKDDDWILVHDAARPLVKPSEIENLLKTIEDSKIGGILATPATDTIKIAEGDNLIRKTINRDKVWLALTPQVFRFKVLNEALSKAKKGGFEVTDEAQAVEMLHYKPMLIRGSATNIKITYPEDLAYASFLLQQD